MSKRPKTQKRGRTQRTVTPELRIIGGRLRGSKLEYSGDQTVRPMKDRVREAMFNLLGKAVEGKHAVDLFGGTGALALETLSRGGASATIVERHYPTAEIIRRNVAHVQQDEKVRLVEGDTFFWLQHLLADGEHALPGDLPWVVFVSPPWDLFVDEAEKMLDLVAKFLQKAPGGSLIVVESDQRFDPETLPEAKWQVRTYSPAVLAICET